MIGGRWVPSNQNDLYRRWEQQRKDDSKLWKEFNTRITRKSVTKKVVSGKKGEKEGITVRSEYIGTPESAHQRNKRGVLSGALGATSSGLMRGDFIRGQNGRWVNKKKSEMVKQRYEVFKKKK